MHGPGRGHTFFTSFLIQPRHHDDPALDTLGGTLSPIVFHTLKLTVFPLIASLHTSISSTAPLHLTPRDSLGPLRRRCLSSLGSPGHAVGLSLLQLTLPHDGSNYYPKHIEARARPYECCVCYMITLTRPPSPFPTQHEPLYMSGSHPTLPNPSGLPSAQRHEPRK
jgi:hypothetical protein